MQTKINADHANKDTSQVMNHAAMQSQPPTLTLLLTILLRMSRISRIALQSQNQRH